MSKYLVAHVIRLALAAAFIIGFADRAVAAPILSDLHVYLTEDDEFGLIANITGGVEVQPGDLFFDGYEPFLNEDGRVVDPFAPPIQFNDSPFMSLVFASVLGQPVNSLPEGTVLFQISGLTAGAMYTGSIGVFQFDSPVISRTFEFTASAGPAPVPEPTTLVLTGFGMAALLRKRLMKRRAQA
jgi:hypothetical protein